MKKLILLAIILIVSTITAQYNGAWYAVNKINEYGYKYSAPVATYPYQSPMAVYSSDTGRTYFVFGGVTNLVDTTLLCQIGYYDHSADTSSDPITIRRFTEDFLDAHANPCINIDDSGYLYVVSAARSAEDGIIYKSSEPYEIDSWDTVHTNSDLQYPHLWVDSDSGFVLFYTKYGGGRMLWYKKSTDGVTWPDSGDQIADFYGHYSVTWYDGTYLHVAFNYHVAGNVDDRANIYYIKSDDWGNTWTSADGTGLTLPLDTAVNNALVYDSETDGYNIYPHAVRSDSNGNPIILYTITNTWIPGDRSYQRQAVIHHYTTSWDIDTLCPVYHNYTTGTLDIIGGDEWVVFMPSDMGPQAWRNGGDIVKYTSSDSGETWTKSNVTSSLRYNNNYLKSVLNADTSFWCFWAKANADTQSVSTLYRSTLGGTSTAFPNSLIDTVPYQTSRIVIGEGTDLLHRVKDAQILPSQANKAWGPTTSNGFRLNSYKTLMRVKFEDLIPVGYTVESCSLYFALYYSPSGTIIARSHALKDPWGVNNFFAGYLQTTATDQQPTYNHRFAPDTTWRSGSFGSSDYYSDTLGTVTLVASDTADQWFAMDLGSSAFDWHMGSKDNNGFCILSNVAISQAMHSSEATVDSLRPYIVLNIVQTSITTDSAKVYSIYGTGTFSAEPDSIYFNSTKGVLSDSSTTYFTGTPATALGYGTHDMSLYVGGTEFPFTYILSSTSRPMNNFLRRIFNFNFGW